MSKRSKFIAALGVGLATFAAGIGVALATTNNPVIEGTTNHSVYKVGRDITITGTVNGDIFCAGQTVTIDATVNGDIICAAQTVTVDGNVDGNIRVAGQTVTLGADVARAASLAGQDVTVQNNARVARDLSLASQTGTVNGPVGRDITGAVHTLILDTKVGRNVDVRLNKLELQKTALINGNLTYTAETTGALHRDVGAQILGRQTYHKVPVHQGRGHMLWGVWFAWHIYWGVAMVVLSVVLAALFPQLFNRWNKVGQTRFWVALLTGFLAMLVVPVVIVALFISILGVPLALLLLASWLIAAAVSGPLAAYYAGSQIMRGETRIPLIMLAGAALLAVVCLLPILGWIVTVLAYWYGVGVLLLNLKGSFKTPNYRA